MVLAQTIHAAGESSPGNLPSGTYAVALAVCNEQELLKLEAKLKHFKIPHVAIREPDRADELMAIGIYPCSKSSVKKILSSIPLYKIGD